MRYVAPARGTIDPEVFLRPPLSEWPAHAHWLRADTWPRIDALNAARPAAMRERFVAQTPALLDDGLHYEQRIAERGDIATRESNWHDLFNAMAWLRYPDIKRALNLQQVIDIARMGTKHRSRAQYAMTHFDEAGVIVVLRDHRLLDAWNAHDWHALFWRERAAWHDGRISIDLFGHALMEHALTPGKLLVGKALVFLARGLRDSAVTACAECVRRGTLLRDPLDLRPLPLSGIPGWHPENGQEAFHRNAACYQPRREGRRYPAPLSI
jgi:hypothetical protein